MFVTGGDDMIYVVKQGDTLFSIANNTGVPAWKIAFDNQLGTPYQLAIGQALLILQPEEKSELRGDMYVTDMHIPLLNLTFWSRHFRH